MLANIGDATFHKNLKRDFNVNSLPPKNLVDQWETFKAIAERKKSKWSVELLIMSGVWIEKMRKDPRWQEFYSILLENAWIASSYERNQMFYQYALSRAQDQRNLEPNLYLADTAQHLLFPLAFGALPGFRPATDNSIAPIELIQKIYVESYSLKNMRLLFCISLISI